MSRRVVFLLSLVLAATGFAAAPASAAGSFSVSLTSSKSVIDVGQATVLKGKVSGVGSARKLVAVYQRIGTGAWTKVGTTRTTKKGLYAFRATSPSAGTLAYRVLAPRAKKVGAGVSKTVSLQSWRWLDLYDQPYLTGNGIVSRGAYSTVTIGGKKPAAHTFGLGNGSFVAWNFDSTCDRVTAQYGLSDSDAGVTRTIRFETTTNVDLTATGGQALSTYNDPATSAVGYFEVVRTDGNYLYLVSPRAHCQVNQLAVAVD